MTVNHGDTLVCELRLGDRVWSHGVDIGTVIGLQVLAGTSVKSERPRITVWVIGGELFSGASDRYEFLAVDHVHVGTSLATAHGTFAAGGLDNPQARRDNLARLNTDKGMTA